MVLVPPTLYTDYHILQQCRKNIGRQSKIGREIVVRLLPPSVIINGFVIADAIIIGYTK